MSTDVVLFLLYGVPFVAFIAAWFVFFGRLNGTLPMGWKRLAAIETALFIIALSSFLLAADYIQRR